MVTFGVAPVVAVQPASMNSAKPLTAIFTTCPPGGGRPQTGQLLATTSDPVLPGSKLPPGGNTTLYLSMGWTSTLTAPAGS